MHQTMPQPIHLNQTMQPTTDRRMRMMQSTAIISPFQLRSSGPLDSSSWTQQDEVGGIWRWTKSKKKVLNKLLKKVN